MKVIVKAIMIALIRSSRLKRIKNDTNRRKSTIESEKISILVTVVIAIHKREGEVRKLKVKESFIKERRRERNMIIKNEIKTNHPKENQKNNSKKIMIS